MEGEIITELIDLGVTGLFLGYLIFQNKKYGAQLSAMTKKYEDLFERVLKAVE
jgi:hypothetical protein|tara:strand:- start:12859 stop:13017 length:159 start_codon:yes stop_codon:yes gene_type:complete